MTKNYQSIFNDTLTKIRFAVCGAVENDGPLMRAIVKALYGMSDELIQNGIIENREQGTRYGMDQNTNQPN